MIFSPYDLSCALEKYESFECEGYARQDAARIGLNVLMYSLARTGVPHVATPQPGLYRVVPTGV